MYRQIATIFAVLSIVSAHPPDLRIIGGHHAKPGEVPYQAAVFFTNPRGTGLCAGAILNKQWIITAAHCTVDATEFRIQVGSVTLEGDDPNRVTQIATHVEVHPEFTLEPLVHDLALIKLDTPLEFNDYIQSIKLNTDDHFLDSLPAQISGWGLTSDLTSELSNNLKIGGIKTINYVSCGLSTRLNIGEPFNICMKATSDSIGPCQGDSGGPLVYEGTLLGVISYISTYGCNSLEENTVSVRISSHADWIRKVIRT